MAKAPTEEQSQLKRRAQRRLVGSIALVTVVAVVLPWVLEREPKFSEQQIAIQIPSPNAGKFEPKPPASAPSPTTQSKAEPPGTMSAEQTAPGADAAAKELPGDETLRAEQAKVLAAPVKPAPSKAAPPKDREVKERDKDKAAEKKKPAEKADPAGEAKKSVPAAETKPSGTDNRAYVVQVAALADTDKAAEIQQSMAAKGLKVYTEKVKTANGEVTRVRVGPFPNRDAAEKERARMKSLGFDGNVAPK